MQIAPAVGNETLNGGLDELHDEIMPETPQIEPHIENSDDEGRPINISSNEALHFGYNFVMEHTDVKLRKVLRVWRRKVSGTKTERLARGYLCYRLCLRGGQDPSKVFSRRVNEGVPLFKDFSVWVRECGITISPFLRFTYTYNTATTRPTRTHVYNER